MEFNKRNARFLSMLGHRDVFTHSLIELGATEDFVVLTADLEELTGLGRFRKEFPEKIINVGIAEQNMIGIAAGMTKIYKTAFVTTYANFLTMRAFEQIRMNLGYMKANVKLVGTGSGLCMGNSGNSHYSIEDIAIMRSLPNMTIVVPADGFETVKAVEASVKLNAPVYLRLGGGQNESPVYTQDYTFEIGKAIELCPGDDITMIATGTMVKVCVKAAEELEKIGIHAGVVNMHTIKPLDVDFIKEKVKHCSEIVTVEEHSVMGGLGGAVAEVLAGLDAKARLHRFGIEDHYCTVGDYDYLLEQNGLTAAAIEERIKEILNRKDDGK
jgi:transketolase